MPGWAVAWLNAAFQSAKMAYSLARNHVQVWPRSLAGTMQASARSAVCARFAAPWDADGLVRWYIGSVPHRRAVSDGWLWLTFSRVVRFATALQDDDLAPSCVQTALSADDQPAKRDSVADGPRLACQTRQCS